MRKTGSFKIIKYIEFNIPLRNSTELSSVEEETIMKTKFTQKKIAKFII
jgi:hypothetical protein